MRGLSCQRESTEVNAEVRGIGQAKSELEQAKEPNRIIEFRIEHLLINPSDTRTLQGAFSQKTEDGRTLRYSYVARLAGPEKKRRIEVDITPRILASKGIELSVKILVDGETLKEDKVITSNGEPIIVELLENSEQKAKLADRIVPFILGVERIQIYPKILKELHFKDYKLLMNNEPLFQAEEMNLYVPAKSEKVPIFIAFYIPKKGIFVLSFSPFEEALPIGVAEDDSIKFIYKGDRYEFGSVLPILPMGRWCVWVRNNPAYLPENDIPAGENNSSLVNSKVSLWFDGTGKILERVFGKIGL
jgi:hypothetical protein